MLLIITVLSYISRSSIYVHVCLCLIFPTETDNVAEKLLSYNRANRAVAILCNHQRAPPKTFDQSMANLQAKVR